MRLKETGLGAQTVLNGCGQGLVAGLFEHGNELSAAIKAIGMF